MSRAPGAGVSRPFTPPRMGATVPTATPVAAEAGSSPGGSNEPPRSRSRDNVSKTAVRRKKGARLRRCVGAGVGPGLELGLRRWAGREDLQARLAAADAVAE